MKLVFVHLNGKIPVFLEENIRRARILFPDKEVYLGINTPQNLEFDENVKLIEFDASTNNQLFEDHALNSDFRNGFWQISIERILLLAKIHEKFPNESLLHIESDVILSSLFPFEKVDSLQKIHWLNFNNNLDVGALIYSPNLEKTKFLTNSIIDLMKQNKSLTDMSALRIVRQKYPTHVDLFPSSVSDESFNNFKVIFDGAIYGMWLFGQDPRNHFGFLRRFLNLRESRIVLERRNFRYFSDQVFFIFDDESNSEKYPIVNFHIHCKDPKIFNTDGIFLQKRIAQVEKRINAPVFYPHIFINLLRSAKESNSLLTFFSHFPVIRVVALHPLIRKFWRMIKSMKSNGCGD